MSVPCRLYLQERGHADAPGVKQIEQKQQQKTRPFDCRAFRKAFLFPLSNPGNFRAKEQHAQVYSCGRRTKPPAIPSAHFIRGSKEVINMKHKTDARFNHRLLRHSAEEKDVSHTGWEKHCIRKKP